MSFSVDISKLSVNFQLCKLIMVLIFFWISYARDIMKPCCFIYLCHSSCLLIISMKICTCAYLIHTISGFGVHQPQSFHVLRAFQRAAVQLTSEELWKWAHGWKRQKALRAILKEQLIKHSSDIPVEKIKVYKGYFLKCNKSQECLVFISPDKRDFFLCEHAKWNWKFDWLWIIIYRLAYIYIFFFFFWEGMTLEFELKTSCLGDSKMAARGRKQKASFLK
jgi:hypothetical protein